MGIKDKAQDMFGAALEQAPSLIGELMLTGTAGTVAPGVMNAMLAYQQKRQERMYTIFMEEVKEHLELIDARLARLSREALLNFKNKYFGMVSDYVLEEVQEKKIRYLTTGFINLAGMEEADEDFILFYYDTLKGLRLKDLAVLQFKNSFHTSIQEELFKPMKLDWDQYRAIQEKLERAGLLTTRREEKEDDLYRNLENIQQYIQDMDRGKKAKLKTLKRLESQDAYQISRFGRNFLGFFTDLHKEGSTSH